MLVSMRAGDSSNFLVEHYSVPAPDQTDTHDVLTGQPFPVAD